MAQKPIFDLATATANASSRTLGTDAFAGPVRPGDDGIPDDAVFFLPGTAVDPVRTAQGGKHDVARVDVRVRGDADDFDTPYELSRTLIRVMRGLSTAAGSDLEDYSDVFVRASDPISLGQDDQERWEFNIPTELRYVSI
jgi:hypothetical protein